MVSWDDLRVFLALARHRSLSAAAKALGVTQPTVGRRIADLERSVGARLVKRTPAGFVLTAAGESVRARIERMDDDALAVERLLSGTDDGASGFLRVTTTDWLARAVLGQMLARFAARRPRITVEIVADARWLTLHGREAGLALLLSFFKHQGVLPLRVAHVAFGIYASKAYLAVHGEPDFGARCADHTVVAMSEDSAPRADAAWMRTVSSAAHVALRTTSRDTAAQMAAAGAGIVCLPRCLGDPLPDLVRIAPPRPPHKSDIWLGVHRDTQTTPRVRALVDDLIEGFAAAAPVLDPSS